MTPRPVDAILVVARELGIDEIYAIGGAQGVAALAYGTASIAPVDKIVGPGKRVRDGRQAARLEPRRHRPPRRAERGGRDRRRGGRRRRSALPICSRRPSTGPTREAMLLHRRAVLSDAVATLVDGYDNITVELVDVAGRGARPLGDIRARASRAAGRRSRAAARAACATRARCSSGTSAVVGDYAAGATHVLPTGGLARASGGLGLESFLKPLQIVRADAAGVPAAQAIVGPLARIEGLPLHAAAVDARVAEAARERRGSRWRSRGAAMPCPRPSRRTSGRRRRRRSRRATVFGPSRSSASTRTRRRFPACRRSRSRRASRA